jgi:hypothetical protein
LESIIGNIEISATGEVGYCKLTRGKLEPEEKCLNSSAQRKQILLDKENGQN